MAAPIRIELPTGLPVGTVNAYLLPGDEPVLVDTGLKSTASLAALESGLAAHELTFADLARVVVSHHHVDHFGLAATIAQRSAAEIWVFARARPWLEDFDGLLTRRFNYYRDVLFAKLGLSPEASGPILDYMRAVDKAAASVPPGRIVTFEKDALLSMGGADWQALHTPGHASTLTCFYQPETHDFLSTDLLLPITPTPIIEQTDDDRAQRASPLSQHLESLARINALDIGRVFPGHGDPFDDHRGLIKRQRERIEARKLECLELVRSGCRTAGELLPLMYAHYPERFRFAGLWMIVGYLDLLVAEGSLTMDEIDGVWTYRANRD